MKPTVLITGAGPNGVTGRRIKENLQERFNILSPSSAELDLRDSKAVNSYFLNHPVDLIIHCAVTAPSRNQGQSRVEDEIEDNLRMFLNLAANAHKVDKMFYIGSGAELDKSTPIVKAVEEIDAGQSVPSDKYGFIKYMLYQYALKSDNIIDLRVFGTINPYEPVEKNVVSNICRQILINEEVVLNRDCLFSFIDVDDLATFIADNADKKLPHRVYNMVGVNISIREMATAAMDVADVKKPLYFRESGFNNEYTANNTRVLNSGLQITPLESSLRKIIDHQKLMALNC